MTVRTICLGAVALSLVAIAPALAKQGKVGLWNVTSSVELVLPPAAVAAMKKAGQPAMAPGSTTVQMCMSQAEVDSSQPPHLDSAATGCVTSTTKQTPAEMNATMICKGNMKGSGTIQIKYRGAEHYEGTYSFKGTNFGRPADMITRFKGDWVKTDCGKVKPYNLRTQ